MPYTVNSLANSSTATLPSNSQTKNECCSGNSKIAAIQPPSKADILTLSQTAKSLNSGESTAIAPEVDLEKVADIKQALANGSYILDAEKVAAKFIEIENLLGK